MTNPTTTEKPDPSTIVNIEGIERTCPNCGARLHEQKCELKCPQCHYFKSCSDY